MKENNHQAFSVCKRKDRGRQGNGDEGEEATEERNSNTQSDPRMIEEVYWTRFANAPAALSVSDSARMVFVARFSSRYPKPS